MIKQSKCEILQDLNRYELLNDILISDTGYLETVSKRPLNRNEKRKENRTKSSQKTNGGNKSQVTTILGDSILSKIEGYRICKKLNNKKYVDVKSFAVQKLNECLIT